MIEGQGEDSCEKRLTDRPRKAKSCTEINSGATSNPYSIIYPICSSVDWMDLVVSQSLSCHIKQNNRYVMN
ncbi:MULTISPECIES: hypothetical protein [Priestia]|uniref:hypothetical protein n=1 Tax=Priestia TaxID=2800373 RepID=UPI0018A26AA4|nr:MULTISPECIES: hypothetical protein [Priestia]MDR7241130.1 hypothetical protein [Priestia megaterium]QTL51465.1 hypothetical protein J5Z55_10480 [Priestia aryabhattai]USL44454.1 hypothetical protein LIS78_10505 [Priestia megaterium]